MQNDGMTFYRPYLGNTVVQSAQGFTSDSLRDLTTKRFTPAQVAGNLNYRWQTLYQSNAQAAQAAIQLAQALVNVYGLPVGQLNASLASAAGLQAAMIAKPIVVTTTTPAPAISPPASPVPIPVPPPTVSVPVSTTVQPVAPPASGAVVPSQPVQVSITQPLAAGGSVPATTADITQIPDSGGSITPLLAVAGIVAAAMALGFGRKRKKGRRRR